jgi:anti-sigma factor RsiW
MADHGKGTIMSFPSCEWVHRRLPLLVGDSDGLTDEGSDLDAPDRDRIERHLAECAPCRERRTELEQTIAILGLAAEQMAVGPGAPSLWPMLEQRIQQYHIQQSRSSWHRLARLICPRMIRNAFDRLDRAWGHLPGELPLHLAWARDSFHEWMGGLSSLTRSVKALKLNMVLQNVTPRLGVVLGGAMAVVAALLVVAVVDRQRFHAESQIAANTGPIPRLDPYRSKMREEAMHVVTSVPSTNTRVSNSLVQGDTTPVAEIPVPGQAVPAKAIGTATAAATVAPTSSPRYESPRYDFDLEHGTPMLPDSRGGKPTY